MTLYLDGNRLNRDSYRFYTTSTDWRHSALGGNLVNAGMMANGEHVIGAHISGRNGASIWEEVAFTIDNTPKVGIDPPGSINAPIDFSGTADFVEVPDNFESYLHLFVDDVRVGSRLRVWEKKKTWKYSEFAGQPFNPSGYVKGEHIIQIVGQSRSGEYGNAKAFFTITDLVPGKNNGNPCPECSTEQAAEPVAGNPITYSTGNKHEAQRDFILEGPGLRFEFVRNYNSQSNLTNTIGHGWSTNYSARLAVGSSTIVLHKGDGGEQHFHNDGQGLFVSETDNAQTITQIPAGNVFRRENGTTLTFDSTGLQTEIRDRNGNNQQLVYTDGKLASVVDNFGRQIGFSYDENDRIDTLSTPVGVFSYSYDLNGNLVQVDKPDGTRISYIYDDPSDSNNLTGIINENDIRSLTVVYDS